MSQESTPSSLSHVRQDGSAHMVDVSDKAETSRQATAEAYVHTTEEVMALINTDGMPKGDALAVARIAGIMGAKKTSELIPLCHPLPISKVVIDFGLETANVVRIAATVKTRGVTGVEMEALTAVTVAALAVIDMVKGVDRSAVISNCRITHKSGGRSGDWHRE